MSETSRDKYYRELKEQERQLKLEQNIRDQEKSNRQLKEDLYPSRLTRVSKAAGSVANALFTGASHSTVHSEPKPRKKKKKSRSHSGGRPQFSDFSVFA